MQTEARQGSQVSYQSDGLILRMPLLICLGLPQKDFYWFWHREVWRWAGYRGAASCSYNHHATHLGSVKCKKEPVQLVESDIFV